MSIFYQPKAQTAPSTRRNEYPEPDPKPAGSNQQSLGWKQKQKQKQSLEKFSVETTEISRTNGISDEAKAAVADGSLDDVVVTIVVFFDLHEAR